MSNLTIQYIIVGLIILAAVVYFTKSMRSSFRGKKSCGKGCDCTVTKITSKEAK